jgi:hypothetical protein
MKLLLIQNKILIKKINLIRKNVEEIGKHHKKEKFISLFIKMLPIFQILKILQ